MSGSVMTGRRAPVEAESLATKSQTARTTGWGR